MSANDTMFAARPIGLPPGPREDYQPPKIPPYRRDERENPTFHAIPKVEVVEASEQQGENVLKRTIPTNQNMPYPEQIKAAIQDGYHLTSDIVAATGLNRKAVIKTISYMIRSTGLLEEKPVPRDAADGDRYVVFTEKGKLSLMQEKKEVANAAAESTKPVGNHEGVVKPPVSMDHTPEHNTRDEPEHQDEVSEKPETEGVNIPAEHVTPFKSSMAQLYEQALTHMGALMETMNEMVSLHNEASAEVEHYKQVVENIKKTLN